MPRQTWTKDATTDLRALLHAAQVPGPYVLVGHSYAGLVTRLYASSYPDEVVGMVLVDILSESLQSAMSADDWQTWKCINARNPKDIAEYADLERIDFDVSLEQVRSAPSSTIRDPSGLWRVRLLTPALE
jgi:pimeloyl-ACP methyl ester carboxylesterase